MAASRFRVAFGGRLDRCTGSPPSGARVEGN
jgi:hypothetical protein